MGLLFLFNRNTLVVDPMTANAALVQKPAPYHADYGREFDARDALVGLDLAVEQGAGDENADGAYAL